MIQKKLNLNCPIGKTGYGITSLNITKQLANISDLSVSLFPMSQHIELNAESEKETITKLLNNSEEFDHRAPCLKIWHQFDLASRIGSGKYFSFPFFEVDTLKPKEKVHLNSCDGIFVASRWAKDVLINNGVHKPIYVAPLAVDMNIFQSPPSIKLQKDNYVFFHIGKWEHRKAQDFLFECFDAAFTENDNVELWILPHNPFLSEDETKKWVTLMRNRKLNKKIKLWNRLPTQYDLCKFIDKADCGVFLSRAEGWNNEILESMALSKPIIATNYSAHTEYCTKDNCFLVNIEELEIANDGKWFHGEGKWAKLGQNQLEQAVKYMRSVYTNNITSNPAGLETAKKYTWSNTANIIYNTIYNNQKDKINAYSKKKRRRR
jgi:glycosyltransferase involved in cell wall biosynthesis